MHCHKKTGSLARKSARLTQICANNERKTQICGYKQNTLLKVTCKKTTFHLSALIWIDCLIQNVHATEATTRKKSETPTECTVYRSVKSSPLVGSCQNVRIAWWATKEVVVAAMNAWLGGKVERTSGVATTSGRWDYSGMSG